MTQPPKDRLPDSPGELNVLSEELGEGLALRLRELDAPEPRRQLSAVVRARLMLRTRYRPALEPANIREHVQAAWLRFDLRLRESLPVRLLAGALVVCVFLLAIAPAIAETWLRPASMDDDVVGARAAVLPAAEAREVEETADEVHAQRIAWLTSENDLRRLRAICDDRGKVELRRRLLRIGGSDERTRERIRALSAKVAGDLERGGGTGLESVEAQSLGLRALLAAGSTTVHGQYWAEVRAAWQRLEEMLPALNGPELALALAGCLEGALVAGGTHVEVVAEHLRRWTAEQHDRVTHPAVQPLVLLRDRPPSVFSNQQPILVRRKPPETVPAMNSWSCPVGALADAGLLLRIAPALGVPPRQAARVRSAFYAHLIERGYRAGAPGAAARAALLCSYSDLADRDRLRESLRGYCLTPDLFGRDIRAVHHLAWGIFPGAGWARFNQALRFLTANYADESPTDRAGLLLVQLLYAAPGIAHAGVRDGG